MEIVRWVVVTGLLIAAVSSPAGADPGSRVRASHPRLARVLAEGERRSPTFRELLDRLAASDVIVHIESAPPGYVVDGGLQFVTATSGVRYLRVTVRLRPRTAELIALLGHELRHAVEVAERPEVRDQPSFRRLYEGLGPLTRRGRLETYDTRAAIEAGLQVAHELRMTGAWAGDARAK